MRIRSNYGIIGSAKTIDTSTYGGVFQAEDQRLLKLSNTWPRLTGAFPVAYYALISSFSGTKIYISQATGNDSNTGLAQNTAFATFDKAMTYRRTLTTSNVMMIFYAGDYTATPNTAGTGSFIIDDISATYSTVVVCNPGMVTISWNGGSSRDKGIVNFNSTNSAVYGAIFKRDNNTETVNYSCSFMNGQSTAQLGPYYNCVFQETNLNGNWSLVYNNTNSVTGTINYCTFAVNKAALASYSSGTNQVFNNCFYNWSYGTSSATQNSPSVSTSHDLTFTTYQSATATTASAGVYFGTYSWSAA